MNSTHSTSNNSDNDSPDSSMNEIPYNVKLFAFCAALNSCNLGYDIGVYTGAGDHIQDDLGLTDTELEIFIGAVNVFAMIGSLWSGLASDWYGRRRTFQLAALIFIVGCSLTALAQNYLVLMTGRMFVGLGIGSGLAIDPMYISEISPASQRGYLVTWSELAINFGIVLGFSSLLVYAPIQDDIQWRIMVGTGNIFPLLMIYLTYKVMPESPRWLVAKGRFDEAAVTLVLLNDEGTDINAIISEIQESLDEEKRIEQNIGWDAIFNPTPAVRLMLICGIGTAIIQQLCGIDAIQYYLLEILEDSGVEDEYEQAGWLIMIGVVKFSFIVVSMRLMDKVGRRPLMITSIMEYDSVTIIGLTLYMSSFAIGMGPVGWLLPSEIFFTSLRAKAMSLATFFNRVSAATMASTVLTAEDYIGWENYFLALAIICSFCFIFFYAYVPETNGKRLEDMALYFVEITNDPSLLQMNDTGTLTQRLVSCEDESTASNV